MIKQCLEYLCSIMKDYLALSHSNHMKHPLITPAAPTSHSLSIPPPTQTLTPLQPSDVCGWWWDGGEGDEAAVTKQHFYHREVGVTSAQRQQQVQTGMDEGMRQQQVQTGMDEGMRATE